MTEIVLSTNGFKYTTRLIAALGREEYLATDEEVKRIIRVAIDELGYYLQTKTRRASDGANRAVMGLPTSVDLGMTLDYREFNGCRATQ